MKRIAKISQTMLTFNEIYADEEYMGSIWGIARMKYIKEEKKYMITVMDKDSIVGFIHADIVEITD